MQKANKIPFLDIVAALLDISQPFSPAHLHRFSDLEKNDQHDLKKSWDRIEPTRRLALLTDLEDVAEADTLLNFDDVALIGLDDSEGNVRAQAASMLWEYTDARLIRKLTEMVEKDPSIEASAAAASALGKFIYLGELEEIPASNLQVVEECLLKAAQEGESPLLRRKALEGLGFSSRPEQPALIRKA
jgi:HEAT repeat protein